MRQNDCGGVHHVCRSLLLPSRTLEVASGAVARKGSFAIARPGSYKAPCTCSSSPRPASATPCFRPACSVGSSRSIRASASPWLSARSEEHTSELQSLMRISYAVFCLKKKKHLAIHHSHT